LRLRGDSRRCKALAVGAVAGDNGPDIFWSACHQAVIGLAYNRHIRPFCGPGVRP